MLNNRSGLNTGSPAPQTIQDTDPTHANLSDEALEDLIKEMERIIAIIDKQTASLPQNLTTPQTTLPVAPLAPFTLPLAPPTSTSTQKKSHDEDEIIEITPLTQTMSSETSLSYAININVDGENKPATPSRTCCCPTQLTWVLLLAPGCTAATEATDVIKSLLTINKPLVMVVPAAAAAFVISFGLTGESTKENFDEACRILHQRSFKVANAYDWPPLSSKKELFAVVSATFLAGWGVFSEFSQSYYFVNSVPKEYKFADALYWKLFSGSIGIGSAITRLLTENLESYKLLRCVLAGQSKKFENKYIAGVSITLGGTLGGLIAIMDSLQSFIAIQTIYNINAAPGTLILAPLCAGEAIPNMCFQAKTMIEGIDKLGNHLLKVAQKKESLEPRLVVALTLSTTIAVFLAYCKRSLNETFLHDGTTNLHIKNNTIPESMYVGLSWVMFGAFVILATASVYPEMQSMVNRATNRIYSIWNTLAALYQKANAAPADAEEKQPLLISINNEGESDKRFYTEESSHLTFSHFKRIREKQAKKEEYRPNCGIQ